MSQKLVSNIFKVDFSFTKQGWENTVHTVNLWELGYHSFGFLILTFISFPSFCRAAVPVPFTPGISPNDSLLLNEEAEGTLLRTQLAKLTRRLTVMEQENQKRSQRELILYPIVFGYFLFKMFGWFFRSGRWLVSRPVGDRLRLVYRQFIKFLLYCLALLGVYQTTRSGVLSKLYKVTCSMLYQAI